MNPNFFGRTVCVFGCLSSIALATPHMDAQQVSAQHARVSLIDDGSWVQQPGTAVNQAGRWLALAFAIEPGWHIYWQNPGDAGSPPSVTWKAPSGWRADSILWPVPERIEVPPLTAFGYQRSVTFPIRLSRSSGPNTGTLRGTVEWVACRVECVSESQPVVLQISAEKSLTRDSAGVVVASALASLPVADSARTHVVAEAARSGVRLRISGLRASTGDTIEFFPLQPGTFQAAAIRNNGNSAEVLLDVERSPYATGLPRRVQGLVTVRGPAGVTGHILDTAVEPETSVRYDASGLRLIALAFLSGLLVNVMPCVFPLLAIKLLGFAALPKDNRGRVRHLVVFAAGAIMTSMLLGGAVLGLAASALSTPWGFQMQSPMVTGATAALLLLAGANLLGIYAVPALFTRVLGAHGAPRDSLLVSWSSGAATILLGAPCTAPLLATTLAAAITAPLGEGALAFAFFGAGAATPFVGLAAWPRAQRWLPRSGPWLTRVRPILALPLIATGAWLGSIALTQAAASPEKSRREAQSKDWRPYTDARRDSLRATGRAVFVDFTADWCLTCKVNERGALSSPHVDSLFAARGIVRLRADLTRHDSSLARALLAVGGHSVPTYVIYEIGHDGEFRSLPPILTPARLAEAAEWATRGE